MSSTYKLSLITTGISLSGMLCLFLADLLAPLAFIVICMVHLVVCRYFYVKISVPSSLVLMCCLGVVCLEILRIYLFGRETMLLALRDVIVFFAIIRLVLKKTNREIHQIIGIGLAECILATIFTVSPMFLVGLVLMVCLIPMALYYLDSSEFGEKPRGTVPGHLHWPAVWSGIIVVCSVLFYIIPRPSSTIIKTSLITHPRTGFSEEVDLNKTGSIVNDDNIAMRIIWADGSPPNTFYLSGARLENISGGGFTRETSQRRGMVMKESFTDRLTIYPTGIGAHNVFYPYSFASIFPRRSIRQGNNIYWTKEVPPVYDVWVNNTPLDDPPCSTYLPDEVLRAGALGKAIAGRGSTAQKVSMLVDYLRNNYTYSLDRPEVPDDAVPIEWFLFETRKGHCEFFASALACMLRGCGIPARVVTGFLVHEYNTSGEYYIVRSRDAHAWVEYWDGHWLLADASPVSSGISRKHSNLFDTMRFKWIRWVIQYSLDDQIRFATFVLFSSPDIDNEMGYILYTCIGSVFFAICLWVVYRSVRMLYMPSYAKVVRAFGKKGVVLEKHDTHEQHFRQVARQWNPVSQDFGEYLCVYLEWRFGGRKIDISAFTEKMIRKIRSTPPQ
ncbi:MAG TPA: DUF3488 domain-containing protein [Deltaproteobacteria bacterium]|nr:DUF3488 domain-containing protein [Deltaproteobacteria bacterium]